MLAAKGHTVMVLQVQLHAINNVIVVWEQFSGVIRGSQTKNSC